MFLKIDARIYWRVDEVEVSRWWSVVEFDRIATGTGVEGSTVLQLGHTTRAIKLIKKK